MPSPTHPNRTRGPSGVPARPTVRTAAFRPPLRLPFRLRPALLAQLLLGGVAAQAYTLEEFTFDSPEQQAEFRELIGKLRCLVCQNESLAGSQAELAQDLRNEVYRMMRAGQTQDEILDFLIARYGDFVLYEPPLKPSTYVLWFGPFVLIGIGAVFMVRALLRKKATPESDITDAERKRLQELLAADGGNSEKSS
ncbi:cytochrome c-type biogenesis protein [Thiohalocapsa marina]|uniref:cytochrome c-type biogenesis protein n=1 Tax=Thiohalocapsa marina TaxID=424902 RepID=UPI0036DDEB82